MITDEVKQAKQMGYVVVYVCGSDLICSDVFYDYDDALKFTTSEDGAMDNKAIIVGAGSMCGMQEFEIQIEHHT